MQCPAQLAAAALERAGWNIEEAMGLLCENREEIEAEATHVQVPGEGEDEKALPLEARIILARQAPLEDLIWFYEVRET